MIALLRDDLEQVAEVCRRRHVQSLEVFGSAATGSFNPETSDVDFLVEFEPLDLADYADAYFGLLEDLQELFGRPVNLVMPHAISNRYFREAIERTREVLYAA